MALLKINENRVKQTVCAVAGLFLISVVIFFAPVEVPHKLCLPVGVLVLSSIWLTPWEIFVALLFSVIGDYAGTCKDFMLQMSSFAVAHIFYVTFFVRRFIRKEYKLTAKAKGYLLMLAICSAALLISMFIMVVPSVPAGVLRAGVCIYVVLICAMLYTALMQRSVFYALGAILFVISDFILAWNKFIEPVPYRDALVLGTYFAAQWFLFIRSTPYRVSHPVHLLRF